MAQSAEMKKLLEEAAWLRKNPHFDERPASIEQFLGADYLNIEATIRPGLKTVLIDLFGADTGSSRMSQFERAMMTGGIGIGKTTLASIVLPYMVHWVLCLKDPQTYFNLMPGSRIAFMQMSTSEKQVIDVVFGDIFARIDNSLWFKKYPRDPKYTKLIKFAKNIWILPGDSTETSFEGYNILGGILDEMDSHKVTKDKDFAEIGYDTIESRISSRFIDPDTNGHKGLMVCIGQMKKSNGFANRKYKEMLADPRAYVSRMSIWESLGWQRFLNPDGTRNSFWYDPQRKQILTKEVLEVLQTREHLIEVPRAYLLPFTSNPQKALRDLAGIPPTVEDAFITLEDRVLSCVDRWVHSHKGSPSPVTDHTNNANFEKWFRGNGDPRKRALHIDLATSGDGDAVGIAMGYVSDMVFTDDGERKPYITFDFVMRLKAPGGSQILISDVRRIVYRLRDELGFRLKIVTMDGFNSTDTLQQLNKKRFQASYLSIDRNKLPYEDFRDAIYEERVEWPPYVTYVNHGDLQPVAIVNQELLSLQDTGNKVDHPPKGSKDVTDAMAGVVTTLMGDRTYHKGLPSTQYQNPGTSEPGIPSFDPFSPVSIPRDAHDARGQSLDLLNQPPRFAGPDFGGSPDSPFTVHMPRRSSRG